MDTDLKALQKLISKSKPRYRTMTEMVAATLRQAIIEGALPPGSTIRQDQLAAAFDISRMPIREALRRLEAEGLVDFSPHRGSVVAALDAVDIVDIFELRELLECHALAKATGLMDETVMQRAEDILDELDKERDIAKWGELNRRFHLTLYAPLRGTRLYDLIEAQYQHMDRFVRLILTQLDYFDRSQSEHRLLLQHCRARDGEQAVLVLRAHLSASAAQLAQLLQAGTGSSNPA